MGRPKQVYAQVMLDLRSREKMGIEKYGVSVDKAKLDAVQWMQHAYEESLDHAIYMKKLILEARKNIDALDIDRVQYKMDESQLNLFEGGKDE
jgi:hypothetical protein